MNRDRARTDERIDGDFIVGWPLEASMPLPGKGRPYKYSMNSWISRHLLASHSGAEDISGCPDGGFAVGDNLSHGQKNLVFFMTRMTNILSLGRDALWWASVSGLRAEGGLLVVLEHASNTEMESRGGDDRHRSEHGVVPKLVHQAEQRTEDRARAPSKTDWGNETNAPPNDGVDAA
jgi:hypothetical protein